MKYHTEINLIKQYLLKYTILKKKIKYYNINDQKINNYIAYIDEMFELFQEHEKQFIINVYINRKNYLDINYSKSSFYYLKNKLDAILIEFFKDISF